MGHSKKEMERLQDLDRNAMHLLVETGAVRECDDHDGVFIDKQDEEAVRKAKKIGSNMVKQGKMNATQAEFQDAIKNVIEGAGHECYACAKNRDS
jgi:hypothetical protein